MSQLKRPNSWAREQREQYQASHSALIQSWGKSWFTHGISRIQWHWNHELFGCARENGAGTDDEAWHCAAKLAVSGDLDQGLHIPDLGAISQKMRQQLYTSCGWEMSDFPQQCAAIISVELVQGIVLELAVPCKALIQPNPHVRKIEPGAIEKIATASSFTLSGSVTSEPLSLARLMSLKPGDTLLLEQKLDAPFTIYQGKKRVLQGFLASKQGHRALVVKRGN